jgi:hypothetical protein
MATEFDRVQLLDALDEVGRAAIAAKTRLDIAVYGGSALMLASNFRFSTSDVDIAEISRPWPQWLTDAIGRIAVENKWSESWLNDAVNTFLSPLAVSVRDLVAFGSFPRATEEVGVRVFVPTAEYMLALKLMALRVSDFDKGSKDMTDIANLLRVLDITDVDRALAVMAEYFPRSAADADKQRFVLRHVLSQLSPTNAPRYPRRGN